jgi:hypothetical protein
MPTPRMLPTSLLRSFVTLPHRPTLRGGTPDSHRLVGGYGGPFRLHRWARLLFNGMAHRRGVGATPFFAGGDAPSNMPSDGHGGDRASPQFSPKLARQAAARASIRVGVVGLCPTEPWRGRVWAPSQGAHRQCLARRCSAPDDRLSVGATAGSACGRFTWQRRHATSGLSTYS